MADNQHNKANNGTDEIDLGQLFNLIGRGFNRVFRAFLRLFLYFKKNALLLIGLAVVGLAIGYGLNRIISKKLKTEVIVKPQLESKNYLYDVIDEVQANIKAKDTLFFRSIGIEELDFNGLEVTIAPVDDNKVSTESEMKYLELLQSFENTDAIADIVRAELQNKSSFNHRITFNYKNASLGNEFATKTMAYINSSPYFVGLIEIYRANASGRIKENQDLLLQVDEIIANYAAKMGKESTSFDNGKIVLDNQETVNITGLFSLKNELIRDIESKKLELESRTDPIRIINFGKPQVVQKSFFGKNIVLIPLVLIGLFFLVSFFKYLDRKSLEIN